MTFQATSPDMLPPPRFRVSTADLPERNRLEIWQEVHSRPFFHIGVEADHDTPFYADAEVQMLNSCTVASLSSSRARYYVARDFLPQTNDMINVVIMKSGRAQFTQRGRELTIGAGEAVAMMANEVASIDLLDGSSALSLSLPIDAVASRVADLGDAVIRPLSQHQNAVALLAGYATGLLSLPGPLSRDLSAAAPAHLAGNALGQLSGATQVPEHRGIRVARKQAIKADILANLASHTLSANGIAQRLGVTPRYVRKLLHDDGTSLSEITRHLRLQRARQLLDDPQQLGKSITSIAYAVGFSDLSYFNRCFRRQFGMTPSECREQAVRQAQARPSRLLQLQA
jgi:AraC-like DNA-binding protein